MRDRQVPTATKSEVDGKNRRRRRAVICGLILVGGAIRLVGLGEKCLWVDELISLRMSETVHGLMSTCRKGHTPPGRYLVVWALQRFSKSDIANRSGISTDLAVRLPAALFGTLSLALMFWIGRMLWNWRAGLVAAILLLLSPWHLHHSQDARYYAIMLFLALAALGLTLQIVRQPRSLERWFALAVVCALNLYTSYVTAFAVLPIVFYLAWCTWRASRQQDEDGQTRAFVRGMTVAALVGLLCLAPWLPVVYGTIERYLGKEQPTQQETPAVAPVPAGRPTVDEKVGWEMKYDWAYANAYLCKLGVENAPFKWALLGLFLVGLVSTARRNRSFGVLAGLWFLAPWPIILSTDIRNFCPPRYLVHYQGLYLLLAGAGAVVTYDWLKRSLIDQPGAARPGAMRGLAVHGAIGVIVLAALLTFAREDIRYFHTEKQDWKGVVRYLDRHIELGEAVLAGGSSSNLGLRYYGRNMKPVRLIRRCVYPYQIDGMLAVHPRCWYVTWGPLPSDTRAVLARSFEPVQRFPGTEGEVLIYRSKPKGDNGGG